MKVEIPETHVPIAVDKKHKKRGKTITGRKKNWKKRKEKGTGILASAIRVNSIVFCINNVLQRFPISRT